MEICNAYSADLSSIEQLDKFVSKLKTAYADFIINEVISAETANIIRLLTQQIIYNRIFDKTCFTEKMVVYYGSILENKECASINKCIDRLSENSLLRISTEIAMSYNRQSQDNAKTAGMTVFWDNKDNNIKMTVSGKWFCRFMNTITDKNSGYSETFFNYNIKDFQYKDGAEKPNNISEDEWHKRKCTWHRLMQNCDTKTNGIVITVADDSIEEESYKKMLDTGTGHCYDIMAKHMPSPEEMAHTAAASHEYDELFKKIAGTDKNAVSPDKVAETGGLFSKELQNPESDVSRNIAKTEKILLGYSIDFTDSLIKDIVTTKNSPLTVKNLMMMPLDAIQNEFCRKN